MNLAIAHLLNAHLSRKDDLTLNEELTATSGEPLKFMFFNQELLSSYRRVPKNDLSLLNNRSTRSPIISTVILTAMAELFIDSRAVATLKNHELQPFYVSGNISPGTATLRPSW